MAAPDRPPPTVAETARLRLREQVPEDIGFFAEMLGDPDTLVHWPRPLTYAEAERWIAQNQRRYAEDGFGWWAVELRETGELLGDCGLARYSIEGGVRRSSSATTSTGATGGTATPPRPPRPASRSPGSAG